MKEEAWDKWFAYQNVLEVVPERNYLSRYVNHCNELGIDTMILQIETPNNNQIAFDKLKVIEVLGFDCIAGVRLSYLNLEPGYFEKHFSGIYQKLNANMLFNSMDDIHDFLDIYEKLLNEGENLENGDNRLLVYLSYRRIVVV